MGTEIHHELIHHPNVKTSSSEDSMMERIVKGASNILSNIHNPESPNAPNLQRRDLLTDQHNATTTTTTQIPQIISSTVSAVKSSLYNLVSTTTNAPTTTTQTTLPTTTPSTMQAIIDAFTTSTTPETSTINPGELFYRRNFEDFESEPIRNFSNNLNRTFENLESMYALGLTQAASVGPNITSCGRVNIMGTIVQDSAPYLYPFIIEYSLIGAAVIYVMWKHIGRYPK